MIQEGMISLGEIPKQEFIRGSEGHLRNAAKQLEKIGMNKHRVLQDQQGIFCIEYKDFYLIANSYLYKGSIVSAQREIIMRCMNNHKRLVVYVAEGDAFYIFHPQYIIDDHWENRRGYLLMYNWDYRLGEEVFIDSRRYL